MVATSRISKRYVTSELSARITTESGGSPPAPAWNTWMMATQWNVVNNSKSTAPANKGGYISRSAHFVGSKPLLKMRFIWINRHIGSSSTGMGTAPGNAFPLTDASAEYNGVTYPIPFSSLRSVTIGDGLAVYSDVLDVPAQMGTASIPVDGRVDVKFKGEVLPGQFVEASAPRGNTVISGQQIYFYDPTKVVMGSTDDPGPYTWTYQNGGTATDLAQNASGWVPFVIGVHESAPDVWMAFGDSMTANTGDTGMNTSGTGWFQRALGMFPTKGAGLNFSVHGSTGRAGLDDPVFTDLFQYCNLAILFKGANDFGTGGTSITAPLFLDRMTLAKTKIQAAAPGITKVLICKTCPRTNSTNNWIDEINQTPLTGWDSALGFPLVYNTLLPATFDGVVNFDSVRGLVSVYNFLPNTAYDTTHINQTGQILQAQEAYPIMQTYMLR